jgi:hypothetical protein
MPKNRRSSKRTPRRGGAMIKTIAELLEDLQASRTRATLENIISDLEQSGDRELEAHARVVKLALQRNPGEEGARVYLPITERFLKERLPAGDMAAAPPAGGRRGGAMSRSPEELIADLERDPSRATLENVVDEFLNSGTPLLEATGRALRSELQEGPARPLDEQIRLAKGVLGRVIREGGRPGIPPRRLPPPPPPGGWDRPRPGGRRHTKRSTRRRRTTRRR